MEIPKSTMLTFSYATVRTTGNTWAPHEAVLRQQGLAALDRLGGSPYGLWAPQFGLPSDTCVVMSYWPEADEAIARVEGALGAVEWVVDVDCHLLAPTVRPTTAAPPRKAGLYVHRWFTVAPGDVDEVAALSASAWQSFETTFEAEVIGLFRRIDDQTDDETMMLLNWYPSLAAWEASREVPSDPRAWELFRRRRALTKKTWAITTLIQLGDTP
jgi:hypothetical protein